jgi:hypothetical protein
MSCSSSRATSCLDKLDRIRDSNTGILPVLGQGVLTNDFVLSHQAVPANGRSVKAERVLTYMAGAEVELSDWESLATIQTSVSSIDRKSDRVQI